jgi:hypothetical protein
MKQEKGGRKEGRKGGRKGWTDRRREKVAGMRRWSAEDGWEREGRIRERSRLGEEERRGDKRREQKRRIEEMRGAVRGGAGPESLALDETPSLLSV